MKFVLFRERGGRRDWRWKLVARNGRSIACSGEGYRRVGAAEKAIHRVRGACNAPIEREG